MNLQRIYQELKSDLQEVEQGLSQSIQTDHPDLHKTSSHLLLAGGKRIRPIFVLLSGHFGIFDLEKLKRVAITLELIHMATLVHDDVIDDAKTRRGRLTVKEKWDNQVAMVTGDYILASALNEMSKIEIPEVHQILSSTMIEVCRGEIEQIRDLFQMNPSIKRYFHRIKRKTALLMAISCKLGAVVCQASPDIVNKLYSYGYYVGMAFQMIDDVLDFTGDEKTLGKPAGSDLRQGNVTLPVVYLLVHGQKEEKEIIINYLKSRGTSGSLQQVISMVKNSSGIPFTMNLAKRYLQKALQAIEPLPTIRQKQSMYEITEFVLQRSY